MNKRLILNMAIVLIFVGLLFVGLHYYNGTRANNYGSRVVVLPMSTISGYNVGSSFTLRPNIGILDNLQLNLGCTGDLLTLHDTDLLRMVMEDIVTGEISHPRVELEVVCLENELTITDIYITKAADP